MSASADVQLAADASLLSGHFLSQVVDQNYTSTPHIINRLWTAGIKILVHIMFLVECQRFSISKF